MMDYYCGLATGCSYMRAEHGEKKTFSQIIAADEQIFETQNFDSCSDK